MSLNTVPNNTKPSSNQTWPCSVRIQFPDVRDQSKLVSEKYEIAGIGAVWWIEVVPANSARTFNDSDQAPEMKFTMEFEDKEMMDSTRLKARINIKETSVNTTKNVFFDDLVRIFFKSPLIIEMNPLTYKSAHDVYVMSSGMLARSAYTKDRDYVYEDSDDEEEEEAGPWSMDAFDFDASISLEYSGPFDRVAHQVNRLLASGKSWNPVASLLENEKFADFTFNVRGRQFKVHKCLLASASNVLETMFTCGLNETKDNSVTIDYDPEVFKHFLTFIYTKVVPVDEMPKVCMELYELSHRYSVELLQNICKVYVIEKEIDSGNALVLYEFAATHAMPELLETSWEFIKTQILGIKEPSEPKPLEQVKGMLDKKRKFDEEMRSLVVGAPTPSTSEPEKKKRRSTRKNK